MTASRFVVQVHDATTLHFDLRIQVGQVLRSWAVPKGPSLDPAVRRLAVPVEDHDLAAGDFEGVHEGQARGSGAVIIWDEGRAEITRDEPGHLTFIAYGQKLTGAFGLTRTGERRWILVKVRDEHARAGSDIVAERPESVRSGRTWQDLRGQPRRPPAKGQPIVTLIARFQVDGFEARQVAGLEADWFGLMTFAKTFTSGIVGQATTLFMSAGTQEGSRSYVATERITGHTDDGREGSVTVQHGGLESDPGTWFGHIVPGTGTGGFAGWAGSARIIHDDQGAYFEINLA